MTLARIEMVLRLVGGVIAALGVAEVARNRPDANTRPPRSLALSAHHHHRNGCRPRVRRCLRADPGLTTRPFLWALGRATEMPASDFLAAAIGAVLGLLVGVLVAIPLSYLPWYLGSFLPIAASLALAYLGVTALLTHKKDFFSSCAGPARVARRRPPMRPRVAGQPVVVDTSSIIDGRIADICQTGFLAGPLLVPRFVLRELAAHRGFGGRHAARARPARPGHPEQAPEGRHRPARDPRGRRRARRGGRRAAGPAGAAAHCPILTNDYNLNRWPVSRASRCSTSTSWPTPSSRSCCPARS